MACCDELKLNRFYFQKYFNQNRCDYHKPSKVDFNSSNYQSELINAFESKSNIFFQLIQKYKHSLSSTIDDAFHGGIGLLIDTTQKRYRTQGQSNSEQTKPYNFYKDSNIPEVYNTTSLLDRIEARVSNELNQWPDHAVLIDVSVHISLSISRLDLKKECKLFQYSSGKLR